MARRSVRLTDAQWVKIEPHLPRPRRSVKGGRPRVSNRDVVDGILWVLKTGARWRDLPEGYPSESTCGRLILATPPILKAQIGCNIPPTISACQLVAARQKLSGAAAYLPNDRRAISSAS